MSTDRELDDLEADLGRRVQQLARVTGKKRRTWKAGAWPATSPS